MSELQANFELPRRSDIDATFEINIATKGDTGNGIQSIEKTSSSGLVDTYTIYFTDGNSTTFDVTNGNGISSIEKTSTQGLIDTYTIYFTNETSTIFQVTNGKNGKDGKDGKDGEDGKDGKDGVDGKDAKINGVNTLTLNTSGGLSISQSGSTATISGSTLQQAIGDINELIPEQASVSNQLADRNFVNSSISTNTANFIGTFDSVAELEAYSGPLTNNDYAFVVGTDSQGNTVYDRYKYTDATEPASWIFEYELNNSSFTADQWASINSGATDVLIAQITTNENAIGNLGSLTTSSQSDLVSAINEVNATAGSKVSDVTADGTSIVTNGVAVIPNASGQTKGIVSLTNSLVSTSNTVALAGSTINIYSENVIGVQRFSSSSTYNVGDRVRSGQYYFICNTAITTPHAWDASEWTQTTVLDEVDAKVFDTTVNGASVVNNGVAVIPIAQQSGSYGLVKFGSTASGLQVASDTGNIAVYPATNTNLDEKTNTTRPVVSSNLDYAVKRGIAYNGLTLTDTEKVSACSFVGALPNNIYGESTTAASTVQKEVSIPSITSLNAGQLIIVKPTVTSTVANSTLKLNNFDAYPMLYGGAAITTSTDSYVWIKDVPGWWLFDGSNWLFAGHGTDINTTYSAMTVANIIAGTETSGRLMRSDYLKNGIFGVVTAYNSGASLTPSDKYLYNSTSDISALTIVAPSSPDVRYMAQINMSSGSTATTFSYPPAFKIMEGCDDVQYVQGVRTFVPVANKRYQIFIENDGVNTIMFTKGV